MLYSNTSFATSKKHETQGHTDAKEGQRASDILKSIKYNPIARALSLDPYFGLKINLKFQY